MEPTARQLLLVKIESTYGTDSVPVAASDAVRVHDPEINPQAEQLERKPATSTMGSLAAAVGARWVELTFGILLSGSGDVAKDVPPQGLGALLQACGMKETITATSDVTYKPASATADLKSVTIYAFVAGRRHIITGCVGTFEMVAAAGQHARLDFTMQGLYVEPTDVATPAGTFVQADPPVVLSGGFDFNSITTLVIQQLQLALNNNVARRDDVNGAAGIAGFQIVDRSPGGSFNPEQVVLATFNPFADWAAGSARALNMVIGADAGNKITIDAPKVTIRTVGPQDRGGIIAYEHAIALNKNAGDDELVLKFE